MELPTPLHSTRDAIYAARVERSDDGLRQHLGASLIGHPCSRALWYGFRWTRRASFDGRTLRLFDRGQREEARFFEELRWIGCEVSEGPAEGQQWRFSACGGHFGGSMDAAVLNVPEAPATWHVCEIKTHNAKSFKDLESKGVEASKPMHWCQMQVYMALSGMDRALYLAACKDNDAIHAERVHADPAAAKALLERAEQIIFAAEPPARISNDPAWYQCKMCDHAPLCHGTAAPLPTCRSCAHVTPERDGTWTCEHHHLSKMTEQTQKDGCQAHRFIPILLDNWTECKGGNQDSNCVEYENRLNGERFFNAGFDSAYSSVEIYDAADKSSLGVKPAPIDTWSDVAVPF
ncbi:MAG: oxidoreductase [Candidatus Accumulibacter sp.]|nr:oxidoreductase [Accumulibacter sp.]